MTDETNEEFAKLMQEISEDIVESNVDNAILHFNLTGQLIRKEANLLSDMLFYRDYFPIMGLVDFKAYKMYEDVPNQGYMSKMFRQFVQENKEH